MLFDSEKWRTLTSIGVEDKKKEKEKKKKTGLENLIIHCTLWRFKENYFHSEI